MKKTPEDEAFDLIMRAVELIGAKRVAQMLVERAMHSPGAMKQVFDFLEEKGMVEWGDEYLDVARNFGRGEAYSEVAEKALRIGDAFGNDGSLELRDAFHKFANKCVQVARSQMSMVEETKKKLKAEAVEKRAGVGICPDHKLDPTLN